MSALRHTPVLVAASLILGCFNDNGGNALSTSAPDPGTSTGAAATTAAMPTSDPAPTSTDEPGTTKVEDSTSTGAPAACPADAPCQPGDVIDTETLCDPCGRVRQTCQSDCTWGADECIEDLSSCAYWSLGPKDAQWQRTALPRPPPANAPTAPVLAAFDLSSDDRIIALTADSFHVLRASDREWTDTGPLSALLPDLPGPILQAYAVYAPDKLTYDIYTVGEQTAWIYTLEAGKLTSTFTVSGPCCDSFNPAVQPPSNTAVRDLFIDLEPPYPWTAGQMFDSCNANGPLTAYAGWVTTTDIYIQDIGYCFQMLYSKNLAQFAPFAMPGAPPPTLMGGVTLFGERLFVFAGE